MLEVPDIVPELSLEEAGQLSNPSEAPKLPSEEDDQLPNPSDVSDDSFEVLLQRMRALHEAKIRQLCLQVESLRRQLDERCDEEPAKPDAPLKLLALDGDSGPSGDPLTPLSDGLRGVQTTGSDPHALSDPPAARQPAVQDSSQNLDATFGLANSQHRQDIVATYRKQQDCLHRLVHNPLFEMAFAAVLLLFGLVLAFEAQFKGFDVARATRHPSASEPSDVVWPDGKAVLSVLEWVFGVIFLVEMILKIGGTRRAYVYDPWNWMDFCVNLLWVYSLFEITSVPVNPQIIHIFRLARMLRLVRLIKFLRGRRFDSLYLMTTALKGSASILAWTIMLLLLIHLMLSIFLNQILHETYFNIDDPMIAAGQVEVYEYFGTFSRSLLTMFEITLANWPPACRILIENVSEWFILYAVLHKMVLGFAVIGVVNGVFIQETFKVATLDDTVMVKQTMCRQAAHKRKMMTLFQEADDDGNGFIDAQEWQRVCEDEWVKVWLASQELNAGDAQSLFDLIDDGDGKLGAEELVKGASRLRGGAATIEMLKKIDRIIAKIDSITPEGDAKSSRRRV